MMRLLRAFGLLLLACILAGCGENEALITPWPRPEPGTIAKDPTWSPTSGDTLLYVRYPRTEFAYRIVVLDLQTGNEEVLVRWGHHPNWSPDGRQLAFVIGESAAAEIYVMDLATRSQEQLTDNRDGDFLYDWAPDGQRLIFGSGYAGGLCTMDVGQPSPLEWVCLESGLVDARWAVTPLGEKIAYRTGKGHDWVIRLMNPDGTDRVQLTRRLGQKEELHSEPEWSPDGETLIFRRDDDIWSIRYDGTDEKLLNAHAETSRYSQMTWSPDGSKVAYVALAPDTTDWSGFAHTVWIMESDGGNPRVLVYPDSVAVDAVWGPGR